MPTGRLPKLRFRSRTDTSSTSPQAAENDCASKNVLSSQRGWKTMDDEVAVSRPPSVYQAVRRVARRVSNTASGSGASVIPPPDLASQIHDPLGRLAGAVLVLLGALAAGPVLPPDPLEVVHLEDEEGDDPEQGLGPRRDRDRIGTMRTAVNGPFGPSSLGSFLRTRLRMNLRRLRARGECQGRTQGAFVAGGYVRD